uniref:Insulinase family protein n=1 Tax=Desulfobacca acetoxidans TaxID=60893 RepID=A0A7V6A3C9_9BACT
MLKKLLIFFCIVTLAASAAAQESAAPEQVLGERRKLPNGLVWLFSEQHSLPLVSVKILIKGGVLRDPPGKAGLANLTALLLTQGTKKRSATQIAQEVDFLGARLGAAGSDDFTSVSLTVLKRNLGPGLDLLKDILLNPAFSKDEIKRKVSQLTASFQTDEDEPGIVASRAFHRRLFGKNPYAHPPKGMPEDLATIDSKDLVAFHDKYYRPNNAILTVVGDLSQEEAQDWVSKTFGDWKEGPIPDLKVPAPPELQNVEKIIIDKGITQANIIWGCLGIARKNPDFYSLQLLNYILGGGGFSSRLMNDIREDRGLAYSVNSSFEAGLEPGAFAIDLETKNHSAGEAVAQVIREVERVRSQPVSATELEEAKSYLIGSFPAKMDSVSKRAALLAYVEFYGLGLDYPWRYPSLIKNLTPADLQKTAEKYLHPERYLLVVVGNQSEMPGFAPATTSPGDKETKHD